MKILKTWLGDYPIAELKRLPADQRTAGVGFIGDASVFEGVWKAFKAGDTLPDVDFDRYIVVFCRNVESYSRISISSATVEDGVVEVRVNESVDKRPTSDRVSMVLAVIPRQGVRAVRSRSGQTAMPPA